MTDGIRVVHNRGRVEEGKDTSPICVLSWLGVYGTTLRIIRTVSGRMGVHPRDDIDLRLFLVRRAIFHIRLR
jgi:hypothetical protein